MAATSGKLFAAGQAGERFAGAQFRRNRCGRRLRLQWLRVHDRAARPLSLAQSARTSAAGMTGGMAFLYDAKRRFDVMANPETIIWKPVVTDHWAKVLRDLIGEHVRCTGSLQAKTISTTGSSS